MSKGLRFRDRIRLIDQTMTEAGVAHGFGGAIALAYHVGDPRATRDIDLNVAVTTSKADAVLSALPDGVTVPPSAVETIQRDGQIRLWWDDVPVDLFFPQHAFHDEVARDTSNVAFMDGEIPVISATHLAVFKSLFNRPRDWPDIEAMLESGTVDAPVALDWVRRLVGVDSAPFTRLAELVDRVASSTSRPPGSEMDRPQVDWGELGS